MNPNMIKKYIPPKNLLLIAISITDSDVEIPIEKISLTPKKPQTI